MRMTARDIHQLTLNWANPISFTSSGISAPSQPEAWRGRRNRQCWIQNPACVRDNPLRVTGSSLRRDSKGHIREWLVAGWQMLWEIKQQRCGKIAIHHNSTHLDSGMKFLFYLPQLPKWDVLGAWDHAFKKGKWDSSTLLPTVCFLVIWLGVHMTGVFSVWCATPPQSHHHQWMGLTNNKWEPPNLLAKVNIFSS